MNKEWVLTNTTFMHCQSRKITTFPPLPFLHQHTSTFHIFLSTLCIFSYWHSLIQQTQVPDNHLECADVKHCIQSRNHQCRFLVNTRLLTLYTTYIKYFFRCLLYVNGWIKNTVLTWETTNIHLFQVLCFQDDNSKLACSWNIAQREADVTKLVFLHRQ